MVLEHRTHLIAGCNSFQYGRQINANFVVGFRHVTGAERDCFFENIAIASALYVYVRYYLFFKSPRISLKA